MQLVFLKGDLAPLMHTIEEWMSEKDSLRAYIRSDKIRFLSIVEF